MLTLDGNILNFHSKGFALWQDLIVVMNIVAAFVILMGVTVITFLSPCGWLRILSGHRIMTIFVVRFFGGTDFWCQFEGLDDLGRLL